MNSAKKIPSIRFYYEHSESALNSLWSILNTANNSKFKSRWNSEIIQNKRYRMTINPTGKLFQTACVYTHFIK